MKEVVSDVHEPAFIKSREIWRILVLKSIIQKYQGLYAWEGSDVNRRENESLRKGIKTRFKHGYLVPSCGNERSKYRVNLFAALEPGWENWEC